MKKKEALAVLNTRIVRETIDVGNLLNRKEIEREIRDLSDNDEGFENVVFELGCTTLAKAYKKQ